MDPYSIKIHCDGAMDYDKKRSGGNGFVIEYPDYFNREPFEKSLNRDGHGIHQLEIIGVIEGMEELMKIYKNESLPKCSGGVIVYTDRHSVPILLNPYSIKNQRSNGWRNHEDKPIKDSSLLDRADKVRNRLSQIIGGRVEIKYTGRKGNRIADRLSKAGKKSGVKSKMVVARKNTNVTKRLFDGLEINYESIKAGDTVHVRVYSWELVRDLYEITAEIFEGDFLGRKLKIYGNKIIKDQLHRSHKYKITVMKVNRHHILVDSIEEIDKS